MFVQNMFCNINANPLFLRQIAFYRHKKEALSLSFFFIFFITVHGVLSNVLQYRHDDKPILFHAIAHNLRIFVVL